MKTLGTEMREEGKRASPGIGSTIEKKQKSRGALTLVILDESPLPPHNSKLSFLICEMTDLD